MTDALFQLAFIGPGGPEILVVMLVLLLLFGAKDAPRIFRKLNDIINQIRNSADGFKREVMYGDLLDDEPPPEADDGEFLPLKPYDAEATADEKSDAEKA